MSTIPPTHRRGIDLARAALGTTRPPEQPAQGWTGPRPVIDGQAATDAELAAVIDTIRTLRSEHP